MANTHPWVRLCELASCSPDFDVVYQFDRRQACEWLAARLEGHDLTVFMPKIEAAYDSWPPEGS